MKTLFLSTTAALLLAACQAAPAPSITITEPSLRLPAPGQTTSAAYFTINNAGGADVLLSASAPFGEVTELHNHIHEDGIMKMRRQDSVAIPGGETVFKPGGLHVMIFNTDIENAAMNVPLTLNFEKSGNIVVALPTLTKKTQMDHSGH